MQSITQKLNKYTLCVNILAILTMIVIGLVAIQFAIESTPTRPTPQKFQCRTLFEQLDLSLKFGFQAVDWNCV